MLQRSDWVLFKGLFPPFRSPGCAATLHWYLGSDRDGSRKSGSVSSAPLLPSKLSLFWQLCHCVTLLAELFNVAHLQRGASSSVGCSCDTSGLESGLVLTHRSLSMAMVRASEFWRLTGSSSVQLALLLEASCSQFCGRCVVLDWLFYSVFCLQMECGLLHSLPVFGPLGRYCPDAPLQNQKFCCQRGLAALIFFITPHVLLCKHLSTKPVSTLIQTHKIGVDQIDLTEALFQIQLFVKSTNMK